MDFTFSEDQISFRDALREFLERQVTPETIRASWDRETGRDDELWRELADVGLLGLLAPEAQGGMGMHEVDFVLLAEACGRAALPEPAVETALVAVPMLRELGEGMQDRLAGVAAGQTRVALGHPRNPYVADAHVADLLLLADGDEVHAVRRADVEMTAQPSIDPSRRLYSVSWMPSAGTRVADGDAARQVLAAAARRGALAAAAEALGAADRQLEIAGAYACERKQFGKAIGSFQAIKHHLADVATAVEFARPTVYRAAHALAHERDAELATCHAKLAATDAATLAARKALQVHGAIGYTWELDLHIWMKRAWALDAAWGDRAFHRQQLAARVLDGDAPIGAGTTFQEAG